MRYLSLLALSILLFTCNDSPAPVAEDVTPAPVEIPRAPGIVDVNPLNDPTPLPEMIYFFGFGPNANLVSPFTFNGKAIGSWYAEGSFPVTIVGEDGNLIASAPAKATGDWRQAGWVPYQSKLTWVAGPNTKAKLVLTMANPAGEGEGKQRALEIPVYLK